MPLLQKPRDPNYGVRRVRRNTNRRKMLHASVLVETIAYFDVQEVARGRVIDEAIKLYAQRRHELKAETGTNGRRMPIGTRVSQETLFYVNFMRSAMTPGELIDDAILLYRQVHEK